MIGLVNAYSTSDAGKFRDWLLDKGLMGVSTVKRVFPVLNLLSI